jgi:hypothetical protein
MAKIIQQKGVEIGQSSACLFLKNGSPENQKANQALRPESNKAVKTPVETGAVSLDIKRVNMCRGGHEAFLSQSVQS